MAAQIARHQAAIARAQLEKATRAGKAAVAKYLEVEITTAEALAKEFEELGWIEPTDPRALVLHTCANCGASVPTSWEPPKR